MYITDYHIHIDNQTEEISSPSSSVTEAIDTIVPDAAVVDYFSSQLHSQIKDRFWYSTVNSPLLWRCQTVMAFDTPLLIIGLTSPKYYETTREAEREIRTPTCGSSVHTLVYAELMALLSVTLLLTLPIVLVLVLEVKLSAPGMVIFILDSENGAASGRLAASHVKLGIDSKTGMMQKSQFSRTSRHEETEQDIPLIIRDGDKTGSPDAQTDVEDTECATIVEGHLVSDDPCSLLPTCSLPF
ncbi:hypothetical protein KEM54_004185 [Ascosphaera aggregata]|nr:hypothetical protein KEM54_004185 [Ascosphaera aggregata]